MKMNKLCYNLDQSNPSTGGFTDVEKQTMRNNIGAKNTRYIMYTGSPTLPDDKYTELTTAVSNNEPVVIIYGQGSASSFYTLNTYGANGYDFTGYSVANNQIMSLHVAVDKSVTLSNNGIGTPKITTYNASFGNGWTTMRQIDSYISSGEIIKAATLSSPIQLSAGKKYLISPLGLMGNVEQTKTVSNTSNVAYSMRICLCDSGKTQVFGNTAVIIGEAEIANHNVAVIGQYPPVDGVYRGSFAPTDAVIEPSQDLTLDTLRVSNGGNIDFGFDSTHPAVLVCDVRITGINVIEIQ